jgi:hypothetical protein
VSAIREIAGLANGLQIRARQFDSGRGLHT